MIVFFIRETGRSPVTFVPSTTLEITPAPIRRSQTCTVLKLLDIGNRTVKIVSLAD